MDTTTIKLSTKLSRLTLEERKRVREAIYTAGGFIFRQSVYPVMEKPVSEIEAGILAAVAKELHTSVETLLQCEIFIPEKVS